MTTSAGFAGNSNKSIKQQPAQPEATAPGPAPRPSPPCQWQQARAGHRAAACNFNLNLLSLCAGATAPGMPGRPWAAARARPGAGTVAARRPRPGRAARKPGCPSRMGAVPNLGMICGILLLILTRMLWAAADPHLHRPHPPFLSLR